MSDGELWRDVATKRAGELWQGGEGENCNKERMEGGVGDRKAFTLELLGKGPGGRR